MMRILFICKSNTFRSVVAEYLLRDYQNKHPESKIEKVGSAGITVTDEEDISPALVNKLKELDITVDNHQKMQVSREHLKEYDFIIAMAEHQKIFMKDLFYKDIPLFNEVAFNKNTSIFDVDDIFFNPKERPKEAEEHIQKTVDYIKEAMPSFVAHIELFRNYRSVQ